MDAASLVSPAVRQDAERHRDNFDRAEPFKHVVIDGFFEESFAERLLADFPRFDPKLALNESGRLGGKAVNTRIREISPTYRELYEAISAPPFLELVSRLSGIPDLILDPKMFGGGTHENLHGQELDPHVDFNYDEDMQLHRRLNLIVYLNKEWRREWGGALEIHSNPRKPFENRVRSYDPLFNRCVMFETNEYSWHGFPRIELPEEKRHLSRKSISIYLYTRERPAEEIAPMHGTFYVQRFLPERISAGRTLTAEDVAELQKLLIRRDGWIEMYQRMELDRNRELAERDRLLLELRDLVRVPLTGYMLQEEARGVHRDDWVTHHAEIAIRPLLPVSSLVLRGWRLESAPEARLRIAIDGAPAGEFLVGGAEFTLRVRPPRPLRTTFRLTLDLEDSGNLSKSSGDPRDLAFVLWEIRGRHPLSDAVARRFA